jgi:hypothetical protein
MPMNVCAVSTPHRPGWRWRITNFAGEVVEESSSSFPSIASAVQKGTARMQEMDAPDVSVRANPYRRSTTYLRAR